MSDSPFLPGTRIQFAWDSTSLGWLKECPRKYQYSMIEGWRSRSESVHLKYGQLYHSALETYDKYRAFEPERSHDDAVENAVWEALLQTWEYPDEWDYRKANPAPPSGPGKPWLSDHPAKTRETLIRSIIWYLDHFKDDQAKTVILENGKPAVELSFRMELDFEPNHVARQQGIDGGMGYSPQPYLLCGHLDRVVNYLDGAYVMDRKTSGSTIGSSYFDQYNPDNQMSLYSLAAKVIYQTPVKGVIIDAVQIAVGFSRFSRGFTHRTDSQLEEWLADCKTWFVLAEQYAVAGHWPINDKSCHHFGGCVFRKVCSKSPEVREKFLETDFVKRPWNPLEVR